MGILGSECEFRTEQCRREQMQSEPLSLAHSGECQLDTSNLVMVSYILTSLYIHICIDVQTYSVYVV